MAWFVEVFKDGDSTGSFGDEAAVPETRHQRRLRCASARIRIANQLGFCIGGFGSQCNMSVIFCYLPSVYVHTTLSAQRDIRESERSNYPRGDVLVADGAVVPAGPVVRSNVGQQDNRYQRKADSCDGRVNQLLRKHSTQL